MAIQILSPTRIPFEFDLNFRGSEIIVICQNYSEHRYMLSAINDLYNWLCDEKGGAWVLLGTKGEEEEPADNTVEAWARSSANPVGGFYGTTAGRRGRFATYIPSILEALGLAEVEHNARNNSVRSL